MRLIDLLLAAGIIGAMHGLFADNLNLLGGCLAGIVILALLREPFRKKKR